MPLAPQQSLYRNRHAKAERIYFALQEGGILPRHIRRFSHYQWELAAQMAGYEHDKQGHIISDETKEIVLNMLDRPPVLSIAGVSRNLRA